MITFFCLPESSCGSKTSSLTFLPRRGAWLALTVAGLFAAALVLMNPTSGWAQSNGGCQLNSANGQIHHVVYIQFDNVHFTRDNPNVASDLEQMPHLLHFLKQNGTLLTNHHTPLIAHTADDILTSLTGVYPERHGQAVSNSFNYFNPNDPDGLGSTFTTSFTYWTDVVDPSAPSADPSFSMLTSEGLNAPAPWVPFTRAGCNVGAVSIANMELENTGNDITNVFGPNSPEAAEAAASYSQANKDFVGIAIHCASGNAVCSTANASNDILPDEPGTYLGFKALYGHKYVAPVIAPNGLTDLFGKPITGFPGFGGISAAQTLAYDAAMLENGVPVVYSYISDAHDSHSYPYRAFGPGEQGYVEQLQTYDAAFAAFFARLAHDGISQDNTLFIITADEGDHFAGGTPINPSCNGTPGNYCTYNLNNSAPNAHSVGEIETNIQSLLGKADPTLKTPFDIHFDMAPAFYISGQPGPDDAVTRQFEHDAAKLKAINPITGNTDKLTRYLVDPVGMKFLHMITGDPLRTPSFIMFGDPNYYFQTYGPDLAVNDSYAWNHGGVDPRVNKTFLGMAGPGVRRMGVEDDVFTDHTDIRPTLLTLVGLSDDYASQGRAISEILSKSAQPQSLRQSGDTFEDLAQAYKMINAPTGPLGLAVLRISTRALKGNEQTYSSLEAQLELITLLRDALAGAMADELNGAEFRGTPIDPSLASDQISAAAALAQYVESLDD